MVTWYGKLLQNSFLNGASGRQVALLLIVVTRCFHSHSALAQITPDTTWGSENSVIVSGTVGGQPAIQIGGGAIRNANLFHSFQNFNVADGQRVYFINPAGIQTILARITGNTPSNILGTLGVDGAASLFLINPNGFLFGPGSRLDVRGSFITTTAHEVQFGNQGIFRVSDPQAPPLLTVNPSALWFSQMAAQPIVHRSTADGVGLQIAAEQSVLFVGGDVQLEGGRILAPGARVELAGVASQGVIPLQVQNNQWQLSFPGSVDRANVTLTNGAQINVRSQSGGDIIVNAKNFTMTGSDTQLLAGIETGLGFPGTQAGNIEIHATELASLNASLIDNSVLASTTGQGGNIQLTANSLSLLNGAQFTTRLAGQGNAGKIIIQAQDTVWLDGIGRRGSSSLRSVVEPDAIGNSGEIMVTTRSLVAQNGGSLASFTRGRGNAGNISLDVQDTASFLGVQPSPFNLGSFTSGIFTAARNFGNGGEIRITTGSLLVRDGARLNSSTFGQGRAGSIIIAARDTVLLDGVSNTLLPVNSGIFSAVEFSRAVGRGGDITISTTNLFVRNGANIRSGSNGTGNSGNVTIVARELAAWDGAVGEFVSSADTAVESDRFGRATGNGGDLRVTARNISFTNGARLNASLVNADGRAGNIFVQATDRVTLSGFASGTGNPSGFGTFTAGNTTGDGGNIFVKANTLRLANGALINAQSLSNGQGGTITVNTGQLLVQDGGQITAEGRSAGAAGAIAITTGSLKLLDQGRITAETTSSTGGDISLDVQDVLLLRRNSLISATAGTAAAGGDGGNIRINARFIVSNPDENSDITANAFSGRGGQVKIDTLGIFGFVPRTRLDLERALQTTDPTRLNPQQLPSNDVTAISQTSPSLSGIVAITTPNLDPTQSLTQLPNAPVDASRLINQQLCSATQGNQFLIIGRGGLPDSPVAMLSPTVGWEDWRMAEREGQEVRSLQPTAKAPELLVRQPERIVEAQGWLRAGDGSIWLTATPVTVTPSLSWSDFLNLLGCHPFDRNLLPAPKKTG
ncbi:filamentous hemagglutinin N-terminal domain-containing protein [Leptothermofonsia sp. ETS-13]|uniref:two-partner secretion domain-containing protein n=1 Tax=Leptothermofonsia sp. ETS-13 TaxID=3035696 RepID=UPI003B9FD753